MNQEPIVFTGICTDGTLRVEGEFVTKHAHDAAMQRSEARAEAMAKAVHYPDCWDTAAYPTLADALTEVYATFKCTNDDTHTAIEQGAQHG